MRKLLTILSILISAVCFSQNNPTTTQYLGAPNTLVFNRGFLFSDSGIAAGNIIGDTLYTPFRVGQLQIRSADTAMYVGVSRTADRKWLKLSGSGGGGGGDNNYPTSVSFTNNLLTINRNGLSAITATWDSTKYHSKGFYDGVYYPLSGNPSSFLTGNQTITLSGDVSGSGATSITTAIGTNKVTDAMFRQSAALSVVGRSANSTGNAADISAGTDHFVLRRSGTTLGFGLLDSTNSPDLHSKEYYNTQYEPVVTASNTIKKYWNGYKQFVSLNTDSITEGSTNKFYTDARARASISLTTTGSSGASTYNNSTGVLNIPQYTGGGGGGSNVFDSLQWFNVKAYGAYGDGIHDETASIQATLNAAFDAGGGVVYFPRGHYMVSGGIQNSISGTNPSSQLYIKLSDGSGKNISITIIGEYQPSYRTSGLANNVGFDYNQGTIIESTIIGSSGNAILGSPWYNTGFSFQNNVQLNIKNLIFKTRSKTAGVDTANTMTGLNLEMIAYVDIENVAVVTQSQIYNSTQPASWTSGIVFPHSGNSAFIKATNVAVQGFYNGFVINEHFVGDYVIAEGCYNGIINSGNMGHSAYINHYLPQWDVMNIAQNGGLWLNISDYASEHFTTSYATKWYNFSKDVNSDGSAIKLNIGGYLIHRSGEGSVYNDDWTVSGLATDGTAQVTTTPLGEMNFKEGKSLKIGVPTSTSTDVPTFINLGGKYADDASLAKLKFVIWDNGAGAVSGIGQQAGSTDFHTHSSMDMKFLFSGTEKFRMGNNGLFRAIGGVVMGDHLYFPNISAPSTDASYLQLYSNGDSIWVKNQAGNAYNLLRGSGGGGSGQWTTSGSNIYNNTAGYVGIGAGSSFTPPAPLSIKNSFSSGYGQFSIQDISNAGNQSVIYESYYDNANTRLLVRGLGHYESPIDPHYYIANEISGGGVRFRNASGNTFAVNSDGKTTIYNDLLFDSDGNYDIGNSGAQRPRNIYASVNGIFGGNVSVSDDAYDATTWNGSVNVPTKNAIRDKIEALGTIASTSSILKGNGSGSAVAATLNTDYLSSASNINNTSAPTADFSMASHKITSLSDGTSSNDAVNKSQLDAAITGIHYKSAVKYATTAALPANTYANGASGVGRTLTEIGFGALSIDGATPSVGDRVLIKDEATQANNGVYTVTTVGTGAVSYVLTGATDFDQAADISNGDGVSVTLGTAFPSGNALTSWVYNGTSSPTMGTTAITFAQTVSAAAIADNSVTNSKLAQMAAHTFKGNNTGSTANATDLTISQLKTDLSLNLVENTAISTWAGTSNITTVGSVGAGTWEGSIIGSAYGGTGNGFTKFSGATTSEKTYTLPNASATILTDNAVVTAAQGGTGINNSTRTLTINTNAGTIAFSAASKTLTIAKSITLDGTDATIMTFPPTSQNVVGETSTHTLTNKTLDLGNNTITATSAQLATALSDETGTGGGFVRATSPVLNNPTIGISGTAGSSHIITVGSVPTVSQTGAGTGGSVGIALEAGSTDHAGIITITTGNASVGSTGAITLTFNSAYVTNQPVIVLTLVKGATDWGALATVRQTTQSLSTPVFTWNNSATGAAVALTANTTYKVAYMVIQK